jgi:uncharacterized protein
MQELQASCLDHKILANTQLEMCCSNTHEFNISNFGAFWYSNAMKLHADQPNALNTVTAYGDDFIEVNRVKHQGAMLVMPEGELQKWRPANFDEITEEDFTSLLTLKPELIIFGTGAKQRFAHPKLTAKLTNLHIGVEAMDTQAACRTYNILMAEGRKVLAVLLPL